MLTRLRRQFWRIHLSTALIASLAFAALLFLNFRPYLSPDAAQIRGWPFIMNENHVPDFSLALFDFLFYACCMIVVTFSSEFVIRHGYRPERQ